MAVKGIEQERWIFIVRFIIITDKKSCHWLEIIIYMSANKILLFCQERIFRRARYERDKKLFETKKGSLFVDVYVIFLVFGFSYVPNFRFQNSQIWQKSKPDKKSKIWQKSNFFVRYFNKSDKKSLFSCQFFRIWQKSELFLSDLLLYLTRKEVISRDRCVQITH